MNGNDLDRLAWAWVMGRQLSDEELLNACEMFKIAILDNNNNARRLTDIYSEIYNIKACLNNPSYEKGVMEVLESVSRLMAAGQTKLKINNNDKLLCESEELNVFLRTFKIEKSNTKGDV